MHDMTTCHLCREGPMLRELRDSAEGRWSTFPALCSRGRPSEPWQGWSTGPGSGPISHLPPAPPDGQAPCHQMLASAISLFALATGKPIMKVSTNQARRAPGTLFSGAFRVAFWNRP